MIFDDQAAIGAVAEAPYCFPDVAKPCRLSSLSSVWHQNLVVKSMLNSFKRHGTLDVTVLSQKVPDGHRRLCSTMGVPLSLSKLQPQGRLPADRYRDRSHTFLLRPAEWLANQRSRTMIMFPTPKHTRSPTLNRIISRASLLSIQSSPPIRSYPLCGLSRLDGGNSSSRDNFMACKAPR